MIYIKISCEKSNIPLCLPAFLPYKKVTTETNDENIQISCKFRYFSRVTNCKIAKIMSSLRLKNCFYGQNKCPDDEYFLNDQTNCLKINKRKSHTWENICRKCWDEIMQKIFFSWETWREKSQRFFLCAYVIANKSKIFSYRDVFKNFVLLYNSIKYVHR